jgi:hypothetical protein
MIGDYYYIEIPPFPGRFDAKQRATLISQRIYELMHPVRYRKKEYPPDLMLPVYEHEWSWWELSRADLPLYVVPPEDLEEGQELQLNDREIYRTQKRYYLVVPKILKKPITIHPKANWKRLTDLLLLWTDGNKLFLSG